MLKHLSEFLELDKVKIMLHSCDDCTDSPIPSIVVVAPSNEDGNFRPVDNVPGPSSQSPNDMPTRPEGIPSEASVLAKVNTESQAKMFNRLLHGIWKTLPSESLEGLNITKQKIASVHTALVEKMKSKRWKHPYMDSLDDTLPGYLKEEQAVIPETDKPSGEPPMDKDGQGRSQITVSPLGMSMGQPFSREKTAGIFSAALPSVNIGQPLTLKSTEVKKLLAEDKNLTVTDFQLPDDALYLLIDAVETGTFNKVEITKEELERAATTYAGRMFIEAHEWNDPNRAIGQVLKARVIYSEQRQKFVMQVLAVVLKKEAIEKFQRGLYKFVSIGASMKAICSICGTSPAEGCIHTKGRFYDTPKGKQECKFIAKDLLMEELSTVNVPACRTAETIGKVSIEQARDLLAASLDHGVGENLLSLENIMALQEIISNKEQEETTSMAKWKEDFNIADAQAYNSLLQKVEESLALSKVYSDLLHHRKINLNKQTEGLVFVHELLHRWFHQPSRSKSWSESDIVKMHDDVVKQLKELGAEHLSVSIMDEALHSKSIVEEAKPAETTVESTESAVINGKSETENNNKDHAEQTVSKSDKIFNEETVNSSTETEEKKPKGEVVATGVISLQDSTERRAGYKDGVEKAQSGEAKAVGKDANQGADLEKGADYRKGYEKGYKESEKSKEPDFIEKQIAKGGVKMAESTTEKAVLQKSKDEATRSGQVKDYGTRKAEGEHKPEVVKTPVENPMPKDKLGETDIASVHKYDETGKGKEFKPEVQKVEVSKDGEDYGYLKCPKCNQGNIMKDSPKCPRCGAAHSDLMPIKEEERLGDFPIQKTHSAFDTPPMEAKTSGVTTPAMQKGAKLSSEEAESVKLIAETQTELRSIKEHLRGTEVKFEQERNAFYAEKRALVEERDSLKASFDELLTKHESAILDLQTKTSMYRALMEENQSLLQRMECLAASEKQQMIEEIVNTKMGLGLVTESEKDAEIKHYSEKPIETLKVLHEDLLKNAKKLSVLVLGKKFGVPVDGAPAAGDTEGVQVSPRGVVADEDDAKKKAEKAKKDEAKEPVVSEPPVVPEEKVVQGATKAGTTIREQILRSLKNSKK